MTTHSNERSIELGTIPAETHIVGTVAVAVMEDHVLLINYADPDPWDHEQALIWAALHDADLDVTQWVEPEDHELDPELIVRLFQRT